MSIHGILEAMRSTRPLAERLVWQCLENHANGARCWPTTEQAIAAELNLGLATVSRAVRALAADEIVELERHKRRPTVFRMKRTYGEGNGKHGPPTHDGLTDQDDMSTHGLTTQFDGSTAPITPELTTQSDMPSAELTYQDDRSSAELTYQNDQSSYPPVRIHQKEPPVPPQPPAGGGRVSDPRLFDVFWQLYPRKVGRRTAAAAFTAAVNRGNSPEAIIAGLRRCRFSANPQYQPHPTTWLRRDSWLDEEDGFDPVLRAAGLTPADFADPKPSGLLQ